MNISWGPSCRCEDNIKMDLKGRGCEGMDWIHLAQDRVQWQAVVSIVMNLVVLKDRELLDLLSCSHLLKKYSICM